MARKDMSAEELLKGLRRRRGHLPTKVSEEARRKKEEELKRLEEEKKRKARRKGASFE